MPWGSQTARRPMNACFQISMHCTAINLVTFLAKSILAFNFRLLCCHFQNASIRVWDFRWMTERGVRPNWSITKAELKRFCVVCCWRREAIFYFRKLWVILIQTPGWSSRVEGRFVVIICGAIWLVEKNFKQINCSGGGPTSPPSASRVRVRVWKDMSHSSGKQDDGAEFSIVD